MTPEEWFRKWHAQDYPVEWSDGEFWCRALHEYGAEQARAAFETEYELASVELWRAAFAWHALNTDPFDPIPPSVPEVHALDARVTRLRALAGGEG